jgi:hypothetical protein
VKTLDWDLAVGEEPSFVLVSSVFRLLAPGVEADGRDFRFCLLLISKTLLVDHFDLLYKFFQSRRRRDTVLPSTGLFRSHP